MMKSLLRYGLVGAMISFCLLAWMSGILRKGLSAEARYEARRLEQMTESSLQKAHASQDGLLMQDTIQVLGRAPGVSFACVTDPTDKVIAHSRLSELGHTFKLRKGSKEIWTLDLTDQEKTWGTLIFTMANPKRNALWNGLAIQGVMGISILYILFFGCIYYFESRSARLRIALSERDVLLTDEKMELKRLEERLAEYRTVSTSWIQNAVDRVPKNYMVLDQRQRIVAANASAAKLLGVNSAADLIGKSWYDLPQAESCRQELECLNLPPNQ